MTLNGHEKKRKYIMIAGIATVIALLLTSKRAHLLFGVATLIVVYYVVNPEKRLLKSFKLMMAAVAALIGLNFLMAKSFVRCHGWLGHLGDRERRTEVDHRVYRERDHDGAV